MTPRALEIGVVVAIGATLALLYARNHGAASAGGVSVAPSVPPVPDSGYEAGADVANGIDLSGLDLSYPISVNQVNEIFKPADLVNYVLPSSAPINMSTGTPQCGCTSDDLATAQGFSDAQRDAYAATLAAFSNLEAPRYTPDVIVTPIQRAANVIGSLARTVREYLPSSNPAFAPSELRTTTYDAFGRVASVSSSYQ